MLVLDQSFKFLLVALETKLSTFYDLLCFSHTPVISETAFDQRPRDFKVTTCFFDSGRRFGDRAFEIRKLNDIVSFHVFFQIKLGRLLCFFGRKDCFFVLGLLNFQLLLSRVHFGLLFIDLRLAPGNGLFRLRSIESSNDLPFFNDRTFGSQKDQLVVPTIDLADSSDCALAFQLAVFDDFVTQRHLGDDGCGNIFDGVRIARTKFIDGPKDPDRNHGDCCERQDPAHPGSGFAARGSGTRGLATRLAR